MFINWVNGYGESGVYQETIVRESFGKKRSERYLKLIAEHTGFEEIYEKMAEFAQMEDVLFAEQKERPKKDNIISFPGLHRGKK